MAARPSVLIVEADPFLRTGAAAIAVGAGFQTFGAIDAFSAIAFLANGKPIDVIVVGSDARGALIKVAWVMWWPADLRSKWS